MSNFAKNLKFLRKNKGETQLQTATALGFKQTAWSNYEGGASTPNFTDLMEIIKYFGVTASELLESDLQNVHLKEKTDNNSDGKNVHPKVHPTVHPKPQKQLKHDIKITVAAESEDDYAYGTKVIPVTDISVAAGEGHYNSEWIENVDVIKLPMLFLKKQATYLCVKIKGVSMAPTLQDGGYVVIRQLERSEWATMPDEAVFVVADVEGKSYLKRVKNRFKKGFIVLRSDSPDRVSFPSFNLTAEEINSIWYVEWYFSAKMPNIHDQYYTRLQLLEDRVDALLEPQARIKP